MESRLQETADVVNDWLLAELGGVSDSLFNNLSKSTSQINMCRENILKTAFIFN